MGIYCDKCGSQIPDGVKFCNNCGAKTDGSADQGARDYNAPPVQQQIASEPLSVGQFLVMMLLMLIPLVNLILLFLWGFGGNVNLNKKNYARASLIMLVITIVLSIILSVALGGLFVSIFGNMNEYYY